MRKALQLWFGLMVLYTIEVIATNPSSTGWISWERVRITLATISVLVCYQWIKLEKTQRPTRQSSRVAGFVLLVLGSAGLAGSAGSVQPRIAQGVVGSCIELAISIALLMASHKLSFQFQPKSRCAE